MDNTLVSKLAIDEAYQIVKTSPDCVRTPLLRNVEKLGFLKCLDNVQVHLKLENMQITGSFKARGVTSQMARAPSDVQSGKVSVVTMSAGNYGKAFAYFCCQMGLKGTVVMPETAPRSREILIQKSGCDVIRVPSPDLMKKVNELVTAEGMKFLHPFDDIDIIAGYGSVAMEIMEDVTPDVVLVCCGGGGLLSGVAAALRLNGCKHTRIYGVEPATANTMEMSMRKGKACELSTAHSVAAGLSPPFAGMKCYEHVKAFVDGIVTVNDDEILEATKVLYDRGLVVEPSGAASFAALLFKRIPDLVVQGNVVAVVTGGNATPNELSVLLQ